MDSSSADVYLALANLYRARGEIGRAIQIHQNLLLQPGLPADVKHESLLGLAQDFRAGGFLRRAEASFQEVLQTDPRNLESLRELERIHVESGDFGEAIQTRRRIGRRDPETPRVLGHLFCALGESRVKAGDEGEARKAFRRALGHDPRCAGAYRALGEQRLREGKPRKAIGLFERALPLDPTQAPTVYPRLWEAYLAADDLVACERMLRQRLAEQPDDREASIWLARGLARQDRVEEALTHLQQIVEHAPEFLGAHREIGRLLLQQGREAEAVKAYGDLLGQL